MSDMRGFQGPVRRILLLVLVCLLMLPPTIASATPPDQCASDYKTRIENCEAQYYGRITQCDLGPGSDPQNEAACAVAAFLGLIFCQTTAGIQRDDCLGVGTFSRHDINGIYHDIHPLMYGTDWPQEFHGWTIHSHGHKWASIYDCQWGDNPGCSNPLGVIQDYCSANGSENHIHCDLGVSTWREFAYSIHGTYPADPNEPGRTCPTGYPDWSNESAWPTFTDVHGICPHKRRVPVVIWTDGGG
jgi:hypothetical protein